MFQSKNRFHRRNHVAAVVKKGVPVRGRRMSFKFVRVNEDSEPQLAVVVSKKVSKKAVTRNRIRRRIFAAAREQGILNIKGLRLVVFAYSEDLATCDYSDIVDEFRHLIQKSTPKST